MTRCIYIVTVGRSGSSALAGALHQAGISFGEPDDLIGPHRQFNPRGHFEMHSWYQAEREIRRTIDDGRTPNGVETERIAELVALRSAMHPVIWGVKSTWPRALPFVWPLLPPDKMLLVAYRKDAAVAASFMPHQNLTAGEAAVKVHSDTRALWNSTRTIGEKPVRIQYEHLIANPRSVFGWLLPRLYDGILTVTPNMVDAAAEWIDPELCHYA